MQTVFNVLFMPSFVINLFMIFLMRPTLTRLAKLWLDHEARPFLRIIGRLLLAVGGITVAVVGVCAAVGIPVLQLLYGIDLDAYLMPLLVVLLGGGFLSASNVFYNAMVVIRTQNAVVVGYVGAIVVATLVSAPLVEAAGVTGASVAYALSCLVLAVLFAGLFALGATRRIKGWGAGACRPQGTGEALAGDGSPAKDGKRAGKEAPAEDDVTVATTPRAPVLTSGTEEEEPAEA